MSRKYLLFATVTAGTVALDQVTKILVARSIPYRVGEVELVPGFLSLVHTRNTGAAMGMLANFEHRMWVFGVFTVVALAVLGHMLWHLPGDERFQVSALGLITGGAVGNAVDRVLRQEVTDFIRVYTEQAGLKRWLVSHFGTNEWPSFNVADSGIVVGLLLFLVQYVFLQKDEENPEPDPPAKPLEDAPPGGA